MHFSMIGKQGGGIVVIAGVCFERPGYLQDDPPSVVRITPHLVSHKARPFGRGSQPQPRSFGDYHDHHGYDN